jgi:uncharacterized protein (DUF1919 family)
MKINEKICKETQTIPSEKKFLFNTDPCNGWKSSEFMRGREKMIYRTSSIS